MQKLPVFADERTAQAQHRRLQWLMLGFIVACVGALSGLLLGFGAARALPLDTLLIMILGVPVGLAVLLYALLYFSFVRGRRDDGDHPWRWAAVKTGLMLKRSNGKIHEGSWAEWRFKGYRYMTIRNQRGVIGLEVSLNGETFLIDLKRINGLRLGGRLARAVVQQLAVEGDKP
ncbi:MAG: hypothetical protein ABI439_11395 [Rhodospirillales bacterium]